MTSKQAFYNATGGRNAERFQGIEVSFMLNEPARVTKRQVMPDKTGNRSINAHDPVAGFAVLIRYFDLSFWQSLH